MSVDLNLQVITQIIDPDVHQPLNDNISCLPVLGNRPIRFIRHDHHSFYNRWDCRHRSVFPVISTAPKLLIQWLGTTLVLIASDAFATYKTATGGVLDKTTGLLLITKTQLSNRKSLFFRTPSGVRVIKLSGVIHSTHMENL